MKSYDVIFLHPPAALKQEDAIVQYPLVPMGMFALASELQKNNFSVKFTNLGLEHMLSSSYDVEKYIRSIQSKVFAIGLHWSVHSDGAINVANLCKKHHPNSLVVLRGFTATWFCNEILRRYSSVDAVILGEAEFSIVQLAGKIVDGKNWQDARISVE